MLKNPDKQEINFNIRIPRYKTFTKKKNNLSTNCASKEDIKETINYKMKSVKLCRMEILSWVVENKKMVIPPWSMPAPNIYLNKRLTFTIFKRSGKPTRLR